MQRRTSPIGGILPSRVSILAVWLLAGCIGLLCLSSSAWAQSSEPGAAPSDLVSENLVPQTDGEEATPLTARVVQTFIVITVLSLAPGIAMMITCLPFMVVVLSILRQAIGLQAAPPNMMIISLAIFLTLIG